MANSYYELLKHPLWQEKRLRIMERDMFHCVSCGSKDKTLNVHHGFYSKGKKPWEYPNESLFTLCEDCHKDAQDMLAQAHFQIGILPPSEVEQVVGYIKGMKAIQENTAFTKLDFVEAFGFADAWGRELNPWFVVENLDSNGCFQHGRREP